MKRHPYIRVAAVLLAVTALGAVALSSGCGTESRRAAAPAPVPGAGAAQADETAALSPADATAESASGTTVEGTTASAPQATTSVTLYWISAGENALGVRRTLPHTKAVARAALEALLAGPTEAELATWPAIGTAIPRGTRLLGISVEKGVARVDLSREFASGGGTFAMTARLAQVVFTLEQFPTIDAVEFFIEGERVTVFSSEGIVLDGPQRLEDFDDLVPIDA